MYKKKNNPTKQRGQEESGIQLCLAGKSVTTSKAQRFLEWHIEGGMG